MDTVFLPQPDVLQSCYQFSSCPWHLFIFHPPSSTLYPPPSTLYPPPSTLHPLPSTLHPLPSTLYPPPSTLYPPPSTLYLHPSPSTLHPSLHPPPFTLHLLPSTLHPLPSTFYPPPFTLYPPPSTFYPPPFTLTLHPSPLHLSFRPTLQMHALDKDNTSRLPEPVQLGSSLLKRFERLVTSVYCNIVTFMTIYLDWGEKSYQLLLPLSVSMSHLCGMLTSIITRTRYIHMYTNMCYYSVPGASEAHHS